MSESSENSNESPFPLHAERYEPQFGLTKRELIAAMCPQGLLANPTTVPLVLFDPVEGKLPDLTERLSPGQIIYSKEPLKIGLIEPDFAALAVRHADRLLAELEKPTNEPVEV